MLPSRSGRAGIFSAAFVFLVLALLACAVVAAEKKSPKPAAKGASPTPAAAVKKERPKPEEGIKDVPIATGHDAKGLVLPDFDVLGRIRGKLQAGVTKRLDEENIEFQGVKFTTFMPETQTPDLEVIMTSSVFNLRTQVLTSKERTVVKRSDFDIAGDTMKFEMVTRQGTLSGNVKMVVHGKAKTARNESE